MLRRTILPPLQAPSPLSGAAPSPDPRRPLLESSTLLHSPGAHETSSVGNAESQWSQSQSGLSTHEADLRLRQDGPNELPSKVTTSCGNFVCNFWGPMPCIIWIAILVETLEVFEACTHEWLDFSALLFLQFVNGIICWAQERNTRLSVAALKRDLVLKVTVKRDGQWTELPACHLVRGDIVHLGLGGVVPADCDLLPDAAGLPIQVLQGSFTGGELPPAKAVYPGGRVFQGSIVQRGEMDAVVTDTGVRTLYGVHAGSRADHTNRLNAGGGHFQRLVKRLTWALLVLSLFFISILSVNLFFSGTPPLKVVSIAVVLLVASLPIAMQAVCTSTLAIGAQKLARRQALVCRLSAIEDLASMDVLCSDKTGTLTMNRLSIGSSAFVLDPEVVSESELLLFAALAARRGGGEQDAIDRCLCEEIYQRGLGQAFLAFDMSMFVAFNPVVKRTEALVEASASNSAAAAAAAEACPSLHAWLGRKVMVMKGAPQIVLEACKDSERARCAPAVHAAVDEFARRGFRVIGVARALCPPGGLVVGAGGSLSPSGGSALEGPHIDWEFMGVVPLLDIPRHDTRTTIQKARELGVEVKMVTGDQLPVARETARDLGLGSSIHGASTFSQPPNLPSDSPMVIQLWDAVAGANAFAEVFPMHKHRIIHILQRCGRRVGMMTGDGVNDAPALVASDVGIAVSGATDAARAAADIVLTSEGLSVIIEAIARARMIFERMRNYCIFRIASTAHLLFFFFFTMMFVNPMALSKMDTLPPFFSLPAPCLVLIVLLNYGCILTMPYDKVQPSKRPSVWNMKEVVLIAVLLGFISCASSIGLLIGGLTVLDPESSLYKHVWAGFFHLPLLSYEELQSAMHLTISLKLFLTLLAARTRGPFWERRPAKSVMAACAFAFLISTFFAASPAVKLMLMGREKRVVSHSALPPNVVVAVWLYCLIWFLVADTAKVLLIRGMKARGLDVHQVPEFTSSFWQVGSPAATEIDASPRYRGEASSRLTASLLTSGLAADLTQTLSEALGGGTPHTTGIAGKGPVKQPRGSLAHQSTAAGSPRPSDLSVFTQRASTASAAPAPFGGAASEGASPAAAALLGGACSGRLVEDAGGSRDSSDAV